MSDQVKKFLEQAEPIVNPPDAPPQNLDEPKVPFASDLKLTARQEKRMIEHAFKRYHDLNNDSGRNQTLSPTWWMGQSVGANTALASQGIIPAGDTFIGKRSRFDATFLNDVTWRPLTMGPDTIFNSSNLSVPLVRRICRQMTARAKEAFIGTDPWFCVTPVPVPEHDPVDDADRTQQIERFTRFKLNESNSKEGIGRAIERALILGECAVKTSYVVRDQIFNVEARVLTDINGEPVRAQDGNHITESDKFVDAEDGTGRRVLARDGVTEEPMAPIFQKIPLDRRQVLFEGARSEVIYFKDFLCPLTAESVQTADTVIHLYDKPVTEFIDLVVKQGLVGDETEDRIGAAKRMVALIKTLSNNSTAPKSASTQQLRPNDNFQAAPSTETGGPISEFAEFYMWFDANEDGVAENIMLICDRNSQAPIFYDHVANLTTDGLRPIEIVRVSPVDGRWYGMGIFELFESYQTVIDLLVNRWNFSQSRAGRVDFWRPTDTQEGDRDPNLLLNWGGTYTAKPGVDIEQILKSVYLTDTKFDQIHLMMNYFQQLLMNESGVSNANDNQAAGNESSELATGIIEIAKSGDELFRPILMDLKPPLERIITREVDVTLANMNPVEAYNFLEGNTMGIDQITPDEVRGLKYKCTVTLTAQKDQQKMQISVTAAALVERFYMLPPNVQEKVAPFYRNQLRGLDPSVDVNSVIQPIQPQPEQAEPTKSGINVSIKWETLSPEEKTALMAKMDIQDRNPPGAKPNENMGSVHKLGETSPKTPFDAQLTQRQNKKPAA